MVRFFEQAQTYSLSIFAEEFAADAPEMITIGACCQSSISAPTWWTFHEFFSDCVSRFPLSSHLLIASRYVLKKLNNC